MPALLVRLAAASAIFTIATAAPALGASLKGIAWGEDHFGELGDGSFITADVPTATEGLNGVVSVAAGGKHSLALLSNGTAMGWGANLYGQLCNGTVTRTDVPVAMSGVNEPSEIAAGSSHTLVLLENGAVVACGENNLGQLGHGTIGHGGPTPVPVAGLSSVVAVSAKGDSSFALLKNGTVMAWGYNKKGELGDGNTTDSLTPVQVHGLEGVVAIAAGGGALALLRNGTLMAWGANKSGQLGDGGTNESDVPVAVTSLGGAVTKISAGGEFNLALLANGKVMAWGRNEFGELGDGSTTNSDVPVPVQGLGEVAGIATGQGYGLAYGAQAPTANGPAIADVHVGDGPVTGGTTLTISGSRFNGVTAVTFGSTPAASYRVSSATSITAVSPAGAVGTVNVRVTTPVATSVISTPDHFTYK
jgi:alpha-tubulin suppressor-like RCC1 family protein